MTREEKYQLNEAEVYVYYTWTDSKMSNDRDLPDEPAEAEIQCVMYKNVDILPCLSIKDIEEIRTHLLDKYGRFEMN